MKNLMITLISLISASTAFAEDYTLQCRDAYVTTVTETKKGNSVETKVIWKGGKASFISWGNQVGSSRTGVVPNEKYYFTTAAIQYTYSDGQSIPNYNVLLTCAKLTE